LEFRLTELRNFDTVILLGQPQPEQEILAGLNGTDLEFIDPSTNDGESGIVAVHLVTPGGSVVLD
jgi:hypothetical protein